VDEGSYKPDETLIKIRKICQEGLNKAHEMKLLKTKAEAEAQLESDED